MEPRPKTLRVYPNPWGVNPRTILDAKGAITTDSTALVNIVQCTITHDAEGRPCGSVHVDMNEHDRSPGRKVGSSFDADKTKVVQMLARGDDLRSAAQVTVHSYLGISAEDPELAAKLAKAEPRTDSVLALLPRAHRAWRADCRRREDRQRRRRCGSSSPRSSSRRSRKRSSSRSTSTSKASMARSSEDVPCRAREVDGSRPEAARPTQPPAVSGDAE